MRRVVLVLGMVFAVLVAIVVMRSRQPAPAGPEDPHDVTIDIPSGNLYGGPNFGRQLDISPDGKRIVYVGQAGKGSRRLFVQTIGEKTPAQIPGTDAGNQFMLAIKYTCRTYKLFTFFTTDLCYATLFGQVAIQDLQVPRFLQGLFQRVNDFLVFKISSRSIK